MRYYLLAIIILFSFNSLAQSYDAGHLAEQRLIDRLNKIERNLNTLQKQFYRNGKATSETFEDFDGGSPKTQIRIDALEEQIRDLTGRIEQSQFIINNAVNQIKQLSQDINFRMSQVEKQQLQNFSENINDNKAEAKAETPALVGKLEKATRESIAPIDENDQYDTAFTYLRNGEYDKAEVKLKGFISQNSDSSLISNAYYWLGETHYIREDYEKSAVNFLKGYQKLPKGNKASDNLLKLGMSLNKLNKKKEACTTFSKLKKEFPNAENAIKDKLDKERKAIKCS